MAVKSRKGRASASVNVDLSGVEASRKTIPEGRYPLVVDSATQKSSREGNPMIAFEFSVAEGKYQGSKLYENCSLQPQALFKLKSVLIALGMDIPNKAFDLDLKDLIGLTCEAEIGHETYEGKKRARILEYIDPNDDEDDEDEGDSNEEDEDDTDLESTLMEMDLDDLKDLAKELEIPSSSVKKAKKVKALVELIMSEAYEDDILEALGDDDDDDDEDEEKDYSEMSLDELKAECKDRGLKVKKGMDKEDLIEMLEEDDED